MSTGPSAPRLGPGRLGTPRVHLRLTDSTNTRARELAADGAPDGALVTAAEQSAGRGRQGRTWSAPPNTALLCSLVVRDPPPLLSLLAGVAVADTIDQAGRPSAAAAEPSRPGALIKWPNDVLANGRKVAGILVEGRPQEHWAVLGIGLNVAVSVTQLPPDLRDVAGTLGLPPTAIESVLAVLLEQLAHWRAAPAEEVLEVLRARDALRGREVGWDRGSGIAAGIDDDGRLLVDTNRGRVALATGEVHLEI